MSNKIIIFTLYDCSHCKNLKNRLYDQLIPFNEIEITQNEELWRKIVDRIKHNILPTILILSNEIDESPIYIPGVDYQTEDEIIQIIKTHI